jgi:CHAT domain-containing protein
LPLLTLLSPAAGSPPEELQSRAAARVSESRQQILKTGDKAAHAPELRTALEEFDAAFRAFDAAGDVGRAAVCRIQGANVLRHLGRFEEALAAYSNGEALARRADAAPAIADALVGATYARLYGTKEYELAETSASEAVRVSSAQEDPRRLFEALLLRSEVDHAQGDSVGALAWVERAFQIRSQFSDDAILFYAYTDRSSVHYQLARSSDANPAVVEFCLQQADLAADDARQARLIAEKLGWDLMVEQAGRLQRSAEWRRMVIEQQGRFNQLTANLYNPRQPADVLVSREFISSETTELPAELLELAGQWAAALPDDPAAVYVRAHLDHLSGNGEAALRGYLRALQLLDQDYRALSDLEARGSLIGPKVDFYTWPLLHLLQRERFAEAFSLMEGWRARVLADLLLTKSRIELAEPRERELYGRLRDLRAEISGRRNRHELRRQAGASDPGTRQAERDIAQLQERLSRLLAEVRRQAPQFLELSPAETVSLSAVQQAATAGGFDLLQYLVLEGQVIVWHIGPSGTHVRSVVLPRSELARKSEALRKTLTHPRIAFDTELARQFFLFLVQPVLSDVTTDHLIVVPHEELFSLPFQVFQDPADGTFVGERFRLSYAPSAAVCLHLNPVESLAGSTVLAVAGPGLTEVEEEVEGIVRLYPRASRLVRAPEATEMYLRRTAGGYDILHVASHGSFDTAEPMQSFLELTPRDPDDGRLTAAEMFALPLDGTRLVTLSACETGLVSGAHAGELLGMPRALIYAGAGAVLLSHWKVETRATREWMEQFYREAAGRSLSEAARRASITIKSRPGYEHPFYWAAFSLTGR